MGWRIVSGAIYSSSWHPHNVHVTAEVTIDNACKWVGQWRWHWRSWWCWYHDNVGIGGNNLVVLFSGWLSHISYQLLVWSSAYGLIEIDGFAFEIHGLGGFNLGISGGSDFNVFGIQFDRAFGC